jgi:hypothetical protein
MNASFRYKPDLPTGQHKIYMILDILCQTESAPGHFLEEASRYTHAVAAQPYREPQIVSTQRFEVTV